jgi:flavin-dependent dehydrogenase
MGNGWRVTLAGGVERRVRCLIGADGGASLVRAVGSPNLRVELAPTRVAFAGVGPHAHTIALRFTRGVAGYAWDFPRPDHASVGVVREPGACTRRGLDAEVDRLREAEGHAGSSRAGAPPPARAGAVIGTAWFPLRPGYPEIGAADLALLGDAAGLADPATGEGIHNALCSAELAVEAFTVQRSFSRYPHLAAARFDQEFRTARRLRRLLFEHDAAARLIEAAQRHRSAYALLVALVNGLNTHDTTLVLPWLRALVSRYATLALTSSGRQSSQRAAGRAAREDLANPARRPAAEAQDWYQTH